MVPEPIRQAYFSVAKGWTARAKARAKGGPRRRGRGLPGVGRGTGVGSARQAVRVARRLLAPRVARRDRLVDLGAAGQKHEGEDGADGFDEGQVEAPFGMTARLCAGLAAASRQISAQSLPAPAIPRILAPPAAREGARSITGIVRGRRGGVRGGPPSGGGAARTVLASRAVSHNEGARNPSAPWLGDSGRGGTPSRRPRASACAARDAIGVLAPSRGPQTPRGTPEADHIQNT